MVNRPRRALDNEQRQDQDIRSGSGCTHAWAEQTTLQQQHAAKSDTARRWQPPANIAIFCFTSIGSQASYIQCGVSIPKK
ncbi:Uncharacterised protein [Escherichia coli]|uniref:Uncharacterized protein n=1 Tax=Escherichia coli TaxID=562 RepID=A0A376KV84_ECOLX|nr:Uncharacterised protein [Escherichia coli]